MFFFKDFCLIHVGEISLVGVRIKAAELSLEHVEMVEPLPRA